MRSCTIPSFIQPIESFDSPSSPVPANGAPLSVLIRAGTPYSRMAASPTLLLIALEHIAHVFRRQMGIGADGRLDMRVTQPPLHIGRIPPSSEKIRRMSVTEHMWRRLQAGSFRELTEQIDHSRILHRSPDSAAPPVREDIVVRSLAVLMDQVVCVQRHRMFRDMDHIGRTRLRKSTVAVRARYDVDRTIVRSDVGVAKA